jgi:hypothetical protein
MAAGGRADRARPAAPRWIWWIVTAFPAIFVVVGVGILAETIHYTSNAGSIRGVVVGVSRHYGDGNAVTYTPTIRYRRDDGLIFEAETHMASSNYDYRIGEGVDILYSRDNPTEVRVNGFFSLYGAGLMLIVVGGVIFRVISWIRRKLGGGAALGRVADALAERMQEAVREHGRAGEPEPETTDPSKPGHVHKPKPKREPVVRRMR